MRDQTSLDVKRADFKLDMLPPHLFMNLRVVDEHGRQLGMGRNLGALKAELGAQARGAFQALAGLNVKAAPAPAGAGARREPSERLRAEVAEVPAADTGLAGRPAIYGMDLRRIAGIDGGAARFAVADRLPGAGRRRRRGDDRGLRRTRRGGREAPSGLRRLFALQLKDALKYLEKNIPDLQKMAVAFMPLGTSEELRAQIIDVALDRAFLQDPLPTDESASSAGWKRGAGDSR